MKKLSYLIISGSAILPVKAFAHKVLYGGTNCSPTEEQAQYEGTPVCNEEERAESAAIAYCKMSGHPLLSVCVDSIKTEGNPKAAGECAAEAKARQSYDKNDLISHKKGGSGDAGNAH